MMLRDVGHIIIPDHVHGEDAGVLGWVHEWAFLTKEAEKTYKRALSWGII